MEYKNGSDPCMRGCFNLVIAVIEQAINDCLANNKKIYSSYALSLESLESFLHDLFSDDNKVDAIMCRVRYLYYKGYKSLQEVRKDEEKKQSTIKARH